MKIKIILALVFVGIVGIGIYSIARPETLTAPELVNSGDSSEVTVLQEDTYEVVEGDFDTTTGEDWTQEIFDSIASEVVPTPRQTEGPYYPIEKPSDTDQNLRLISDSSILAKGTPLKVYGIVSDTEGDRKENLTIEIWQTDDNGIYLHPDDSRHQERDQNFQSYGEAITGNKGEFYFETILPGYYGSRPRHIHMKIKDDVGQEILTSQLYFYGDERLDSDNIFQQTKNNDRMILNLYEDDRDPEYLITTINLSLE